MPIEIFQSLSWFSYLWSYGLERKPCNYWLWPLYLDGGNNNTYLHLVQNTLGDGLLSLSNYYSCVFGPDNNSDFFVQSSAAQWATYIRVLRGIPGSDKVTLEPLDTESLWFAEIRNVFRRHGFLTFDFFCFGNWYQPVPKNGFLSYWADRPSALRNSVARGKRRLNAASAWRIDVHTSHSAALLGDLEDAIKAYESVYARSWKSPEPCSDFIPGLVRMAAQQGWLRLGILWFDGQPAAAQLWLVANGKANIYKLAYVQNLERFSVGSILTAALMQHVMDIDKVYEVDYLSGDDAYKADWMSQRRERVGLMIFDLRKIGGWYQFFQHFFKKLISYLKRFLILNKFLAIFR